MAYGRVSGLGPHCKQIQGDVFRQKHVQTCTASQGAGTRSAASCSATSAHFEGMETGDIVARVVEGRVNKVAVVQVDDEGGRAASGPARSSPRSSCASCPSRCGLFVGNPDLET